MYQKTITRLRDYFGISRKEARGAFVLMCICACLIWFPFIFRQFILPHFGAGEPPWSARQLDSLVNVLNAESLREYPRRSTYAKYERPKVASVLSAFDPNTASVAELEKLGIPSFLAKRIEKFRSKGGAFRKKEDLAKIYDFPPELYQKLESYIRLPTGKSDFPNQKSGFAQQKYKYEKQQQSQPVFDINTADTTHLIRLKGIGSKLSQRILKFRDALGGFASTAQYNEIYGLDSLALAELNRYAKIGSPVRKIRINAASAAELGAHSYLRNRKTVNVILNYRQQHGPFQTPEDLKKTLVVDDALLKKLAPYLEF